MEKLKIYTDSTNYIILPKTKDLTLGGEQIYTEVTMVSGRRVRYIQGYRPILKASWDYVPSDLLSKLCELLRKGGFFKVAYPDQNGKDTEDYFSIDYPSTEVFSFKNGIPIWHNVSLNMKGQSIKEE